MTRTTTHRCTLLAACFLAATLVFGGIVEAGSAVLCIGGDGHADVEYGFAGCCVGATDGRGQMDPPVALSGGPDCDGCADLDLGKNSLRAGKKLLPAPGMIIAKLFLAKGLAGASEPPEVALHIGKEALIAALSSVILLT